MVWSQVLADAMRWLVLYSLLPSGTTQLLLSQLPHHTIPYHTTHHQSSSPRFGLAYLFCHVYACVCASPVNGAAVADPTLGGYALWDGVYDGSYSGLLPDTVISDAASVVGDAATAGMAGMTSLAGGLTGVSALGLEDAAIIGATAGAVNQVHNAMFSYLRSLCCQPCFHGALCLFL